MNEDITCPNCGTVCHNADEESYGRDMTYQNNNYCKCGCRFSAVYKFSHIINHGVEDDSEREPIAIGNVQTMKDLIDRM